VLFSSESGSDEARPSPQSDATSPDIFQKKMKRLSYDYSGKGSHAGAHVSSSTSSASSPAARATKFRDAPCSASLTLSAASSPSCASFHLMSDFAATDLPLPI
jgi:hypothetical protein